MRRVRSKGTKPELLVRRIAFSMGFRFRLHRKDLPGRPDIVFPGRHKIIFVHGCFWHLHTCGKYKMPKTRADYWLPKLKANAKRDRQNVESLNRMGWDVFVIWECELHDHQLIKERIFDFLHSDLDTSSD